MSYEMQAIPGVDYLHVIVTGDNTPQDVIDYLRQIPALCAEHGFVKVLIEENLAGPPLGTVDIFDVVCEAIAEATAGTVPPTLQIAYVDTNPKHSFSNVSFAETVAVNRGVNVRVFRDVPSAIEWMRG